MTDESYKRQVMETQEFRDLINSLPVSNGNCAEAVRLYNRGFWREGTVGGGIERNNLLYILQRYGLLNKWNIGETVEIPV